MLFFEWSSPCVSTCSSVLGQASNFTTTSPQLSRTRARACEHEEYIVPEKEREKEGGGKVRGRREEEGGRGEGGRKRERVPQPSRVHTEHIVRARAYHVCVTRNVAACKS